ncbi:TPA: hypothetical protein ACWX5W_004404, partial [Escherichia coli]
IWCLTIGAHFKNDGHYFCGAGGNRPDGSDEAYIFFPPYCKSTATMIVTGLLSYIRPVHEVITSGLDETFARSDLIAYSALLAFLILQVFGTPV